MVNEKHEVASTRAPTREIVELIIPMHDKGKRNIVSSVEEEKC